MDNYLVNHYHDLYSQTMSDCQIVGECQSEVIPIRTRKRKLEANESDPTERRPDLLTEFGISGRMPDNVFVKLLDLKSTKSKVIREFFDNSKDGIESLAIDNIWQVFDIRRSADFDDSDYDNVNNWLLVHGTKRHN